MTFKRKMILLAMLLVLLLLETVMIVKGNADVFETEPTEVFVLKTEETASTLLTEPVQEVASEETKVKESKTVKSTIPTETTVATEVATEILSTEPKVEEPTEWQGEVLTARRGTVEGPSGKETWYNLNMTGVIRIMEKEGFFYDYWVREDGVKMYGPYIMCAANFDLRPRGTILETSLGTAIVCDTGGFAKHNPTQIDIAVDW